MALFNGIDSDVWLAALPPVTIGATPDTCTDSGDHTIYWASTHNAYDWRQPFTVQCSANGTTGWATVNDYKMAWPLGRITFNTARSVGVNNYVRINAGYYFAMSQLDECHAWSLAQKANISETTPFQAAGGFKRKTVTTKDADGKLESYRTDDRIFLELGSLTVIKLYAKKTTTPYAWVAYAWITSVEPKSDAQGVLEQGASFSCEGEVYFVSV